MPAYDSAKFDPPAPVAQVGVRATTSDASVGGVRMLIDSGADVTLLPREPLDGLLNGSGDEGQYELEGFDGTRSIASAVRVEVHWLGRVFRGQFLLTDGDIGILGRNVLNALPMLLDGPRQQWMEHC